MMDATHKTLNAAHSGLSWIFDAIDHNRGLFIALVLGVVTSIALVSCTPKTISILNPPKKVTAVELQGEVAQVQADFQAKTAAAEIAQADLQQQYELRAKIVSIVGGIGQLATTGSLNPTSAVASVLQLCTLFGAAGLIYDNKRKDKVIAAANGNSAKTTP